MTAEIATNIWVDQKEKKKRKIMFALEAHRKPTKDKFNLLCKCI